MRYKEGHRSWSGMTRTGRVLLSVLSNIKGTTQSIYKYLPSADAALWLNGANFVPLKSLPQVRSETFSCGQHTRSTSKHTPTHTELNHCLSLCNCRWVIKHADTLHYIWRASRQRFLLHGLSIFLLSFLSGRLKTICIYSCGRK